MTAPEKPRGTYLGGYDASGIVGVNPYQTPLSIYQRMIGQAIEEKEASLAMELGLFLEPFVLQKAELLLNATITNRQDFIVCDDAPFICGHIDGLCTIDGELVLIDAKTTSQWKKREYSSENGELPALALYQIYHYFICLPEVKYAYVVALIGNEKIEVVKVERIESVVQDLKAIEINFWNNHVLPQIPPPAEMITADDAENIKAMFPTAEAGSQLTFDDDEIISAGKELLEIKARIKDLETQADLYQNRLEYALGSRESGIAGNIHFSWKDQSRKAVSTKLLKERYPEIYAELETVSNSRVFRITNKEN